MTPATSYCQRWRQGRHSWRHTSEGGFDPRRYDVVLIEDDTTPKQFVVTHHYSHSYPASRIRTGLYLRDRLVGVAGLGIPMQKAVLTRPFPHLEPYSESLELSRFVLLDDVPANAETWFLARTYRLAASIGLRGVVAFADPVPRTRADGTVLFPGHVGTIYQAANGWHTSERGTARTLLLAPDGRVLSSRALAKIRQQEQGRDYAQRLLISYGARPPRPGEPPTAWLRQALSDAGVRRVRHPGNYRYLFRLGPTRSQRTRVTIAMPAAPYPKLHAAAPEQPGRSAGRAA